MGSLTPAVSVAASYGRRLQQSTCSVEVPGGEPTFDPDTGTYTDPAPTVLYAGSCKIAPSGGARVVEFGEGPTTLNSYTVDVDGPLAGVPIEATVHVTSSPDPALEGASLRVLELVKVGTVANRRLICEGAS